MDVSRFDRDPFAPIAPRHAPEGALRAPTTDVGTTRGPRSERTQPGSPPQEAVRT
jgi:hypothetical protein